MTFPHNNEMQHNKQQNKMFHTSVNNHKLSNRLTTSFFDKEARKQRTEEKAYRDDDECFLKIIRTIIVHAFEHFTVPA